MLAIFVYIANSAKFKLPPNMSVLQHNYMVIFVAIVSIGGNI